VGIPRLKFLMIMTDTKTKHAEKPTEESRKIGKTLMEDIRSSDLPRTLRQDLQETYHFYLDDDSKAQLSGMGQFQRWMYTSFWLMKSLFLKLSPNRRVMLLIGLFLAVNGAMGDNLMVFAGFLVLLLVLVLELKDKLMAQDELTAGRTVQMALMPDENPALPGWETWLYTRPANDVGGDLVDYLRISGERLGLALGDVAGKGLPAALFMAKLQATLRAVAPGHQDLSELGTEINEIFRRDGLPNRFASLVYLEIKPDEDRVRVLNAGHLPPMIVHDGAVEELPRGAPALGLMAGAPYREQEALLSRGDLLLVCSDGITEARNQAGAFFGEERLKKLLRSLHNVSLETAGQRLLNEVDRFVGDARPSDDLSIVLLKRVG